MKCCQWVSACGGCRPWSAPKADKLGRGQQMQTLQKVRKELHSSFGDTVSVQVFSGAARTGVDEARAVIGGWLGLA